MPAAEFGEQLFSDPRISESAYNEVSCQSCHALDAGGDGRILPGHPLANAAFRPSYWGGNERRLLDAINVCFRDFQRGYPPLADDDPRARALIEFLISRSPERPSAALPFTVVRSVVRDALPRGDRARGEAVYRASCQGCHGTARGGAGRLTELAPRLPEVTSDYATLFPGVPPALPVIEKVRHGGYFGIGGTMPPYGLEALSDEDLGALLTYLEL